jgi:putative (di)nucleoside polyphosphate hydrolase
VPNQKNNKDKATLPYRPCVGMMVLNTQSEVFVARRIDMRSGAWQMPQGGIDKGEEPQQAALRELEEEIGTNNVEILAESEGWLDYDLPDELVGKMWGGKYRGQRQKWFVVRFLGDDGEINIETEHPEFLEWKWVAHEKVPELIVSFKKDLYCAVVNEFKDIIKSA